MLQNLTDVRGIKAWGAHMGIKSKRRDLALIVSEKPAVAAAVFTQNLVCAEPIKLSRKHIKDGIIQAIVINSGNANACTGQQGYLGAQAMIAAMSKEFDIPREQILVASTGVIGQYLKMDKIEAAVPPLVKSLAEDGWPDLARAIMRTNTTAIGAVMVQRDEADCLICGTFGEFRWHLNYVDQVLANEDHHPHGALSMMILEDGPLFIADTHVRTRPSAEDLAETAIGAARHVRRFGIEPKVAFCSQSQFGNRTDDGALRLREALDLLDAGDHDFSYEGEMTIDAAIDADLRARLLPDNRMEGAANVLIFAHADAASGVRNILKMKAGGLEVGPILMGMGNRAHIVTPSITARGLLNMSAIAGTPVTHYG